MATQVCVDSRSIAVDSAVQLRKEPLDFDVKERLLLVVLMTTCQSLVVDGDRLDVQSPKGCEACQRFLHALEELACALGLEQAPRGYRDAFTSNYRALFAGDRRCYRVEILQAATTLTPTIWANGEVVQLGAEVTEYADALLDAWFGLGQLLDETVSPEHGQCHSRVEICEQLGVLDAAWARFEEAYVSALLGVQRRARIMVSEASLQEQRLRSLDGGDAAAAGEPRGPQAAARRRAEDELVSTLGRLHDAAKVKNADCSPELPAGVLDAARAQLAQGRGTQPDPAVMLAERAVESFQDVRDYLFKVRKHLSKVHPQLSKNTGLTKRLACWEESWRRFEHYRQNPDLLASVHQLAGFLWACQRVAPGLLQLAESCDAELFLALPRLVCLCLFSDPAGPAQALAQRLLPRPPHAAAGEEPGEGRSAKKVQAAAANLQRTLGTVVSGMMAGDTGGTEADAWAEGIASDVSGFDEVGSAPPAGDSSTGLASRAQAWEILLRRAVSGPGAEQGAADPYAGVEQAHRESAAASVEGFMNEVEGWSMELQRHSPEAWNETSVLLVRCITWLPGAAPSPPKFAL